MSKAGRTTPYWHAFRAGLLTMTSLSQVPEHRQCWPRLKTFSYFALFLRKLLIIRFLYYFPTPLPILFPYTIYAKTRPKYAKISENWRLNSIHWPTSGLSLPPAQESTPRNDGDIPAESERAGMRMNTAHPIRIQYSYFFRTQGYNTSVYCLELCN